MAVRRAQWPAAGEGWRCMPGGIDPRQPRIGSLVQEDPHPPRPPPGSESLSAPQPSRTNFRDSFRAHPWTSRDGSRIRHGESMWRFDRRRDTRTAGWDARGTFFTVREGWPSSTASPSQRRNENPERRIADVYSVPWIHSPKECRRAFDDDVFLVVRSAQGTPDVKERPGPSWPGFARFVAARCGHWSSALGSSISPRSSFSEKSRLSTVGHQKAWSR